MTLKELGLIEFVYLTDHHGKRMPYPRAMSLTGVGRAALT